MTRHRSLLGGAAIAVMIALGCPSLTALASDGTEPTANETPAQQTDEASESTDPPAPPAPTETTPTEPPAEPITPPAEPTTPPAAPAPTDPDATEPTTSEPVTDPAPPSTEPPTTAPVTTTPAPADTTPTTTLPTITSPTTTPPPAAAPQTAVAPEVATLAIATPPSVPLNYRVTSVGDGRISLAWNSPVTGSPSSGYQLSYAPAGGAWRSINLGVRTSYALTGLNNGTKYYVYLYAVNGAGKSPAATASATLPNGTPRNYRVTSVGDGRVSLAWTTPSSGPPTSGYLLNYAAAGGSWHSINLGARTSYTVTGLRNGTKYYIYLFAVSSGGKSPAATTSAVPRTVPGAPRYLDADDPSWPFTWLTWDAPSNGGSAITGYVIQRSTDGGAWVTVHNGPVTMSDYYDGSLMWRADGLALGHRYYFRVAARNAVGIGPYSATVGATAATVPGSVPGLRASSGYYSVYLSWNSPSNGGSSVRYYQVQVWNGYYWETLGTTYSQSATITGVYGCWTYRVAAVNDVGTGPYSTVYACGL